METQPSRIYAASHRVRGRRYYSYHHYYYHPYRPYSYGPTWHPLVFFIGALALTATIVAIDNMQYRYYQGVYYMPVNGGYQVVPAPINAMVPSLPSGYSTIRVDNYTFYYYAVYFISLGKMGIRLSQRHRAQSSTIFRMDVSRFSWVMSPIWNITILISNRFYSTDKTRTRLLTWNKPLLTNRDLPFYLISKSMKRVSDAGWD